MSDALFARKIYARRKDLKLSLRDLAQITGIAASTISRIENGRLSPALDIADKLASALNLGPSLAMGASDTLQPVTALADDPLKELRNPSSRIAVHRKLGHMILRGGIRRDLSRVANRNGYEIAIVLRGSLQLRTNDGFRENLRPGATIDCRHIADRTFFGIAAEEAELLWIGRPSMDD